jgi:hypothetical protein
MPQLPRHPRPAQPDSLGNHPELPGQHGVGSGRKVSRQNAVLASQPSTTALARKRSPPDRNRPSAHQHEQQAGGRAGEGGIALSMTRLNCQTARAVPDHPLAAAAKSVIGCVYVQASTGGQRSGPLAGVADNPAG